MKFSPAYIYNLFLRAINPLVNGALGVAAAYLIFFVEPAYGLLLATAPMRSTDFRAVVEPILNEVFDGIYEQREDEHTAVFKTRTGTPRAYHEEPVLFGFGPAPELPDGMPVTYQQGGTLFIKRYNYKVYGLAFALTKVLIEDGDHIRVGKTFSEHLAQSMVESKETNTANVLNRAFNGSFLGGDGVALNVTNHPIRDGTFSNLLASPAVLSQTSLEQMLIQVRNAVSNEGKRIRLKSRKLVVSPSNQFQAEVLVKSVLRAGAANNDVNPVKSMGLLNEETAVLSRLTSTTAWWVLTDCGGSNLGLSVMTRRKLEKSMEGDFETDSMRYKSTERYDTGWTDPRTVYGTPGV